MLKRFKKWLGRRRVQPEDSRRSFLSPDACDTDAQEFGGSEEALEDIPPRKTSGDSFGYVSQKENRHGIRIIAPGERLEQLFSAPEADGRNAEPKGKDASQMREKTAGAPSGVKSREQKTSFASNRHGIPLLDSGADLDRLFGESGIEASPPGEDFADLLEASLSNETPRSILKKKQEGAPKPGPISLRGRLKRYPAPQRELDLHGFRAQQADQRTESFVRSAFMDGKFTLRIIVGKGLHSENGPVLPDIVENRLHRLKEEGIVLSYRWERGAKKKSGAVIVYLDPLLVGGGA